MYKELDFTRFKGSNIASEEELPQEEHEEMSEDDEEDQEEEKPVENAQPEKRYKGKFLIEPNPLWYEAELAPLKKQNVKDQTYTMEDKKKIAIVLVEHAKQLAEKESQAFTAYKKKESLSDFKWFETVKESGTLTDKVSALCLAVQESPLHNLQHFETLISMAKKHNRREAVMAIDGIKDAFLGNGEDSGLLPSKRKLLYFGEQQELSYLMNLICSSKEWKSMKKIVLKNIMSKDIEQRLICWYAEDLIKTRFYEILVLLDQFSKDPIYFVKSKMVLYGYELLCAKKEQEKALLLFLVNKFGDVEHRIGSKVCHLLIKLLERHTTMKLPVIREIETFILKPGTTDKAMYYAITCLSQIVFGRSPEDTLAARYVVHIYLRIFDKANNQKKAEKDDEDGKKPVVKDEKPRKFKNKKAAEKDKKEKTAEEVKEEQEKKIMAAALTGASRALPFAVRKLPAMYSQIKMPSQQKYMVQENVSSVYENQLDSMFYFANDPTLSLGASVQAMNVVFQIVFSSVSGSGKGQEDDLAVFSPKLLARYFRSLYGLLFSDRLETGTKHFASFLHLIYKSAMKDHDSTRVMAFVKRILQISISGVVADDAAWACGSLVVVSEIIQSKKSDKQFSNVFKVAIQKGSENYLSKFDGDEDEGPVNSNQMVDQSFEVKVDETYDPFHRGPEYSKANLESLWELPILARHYHPTVSLFASTLLYLPKEHNFREKIRLVGNNAIKYPSDPLQDFTNGRFLDRFAFKNPKKSSKSEDSGKEAVQPKPYFSTLLRKKVPLDRTKDSAVTSNDWQMKLNSTKGKVPVDEEYFAPYFKHKETLSGKKRKHEEDEDQFSDGAEEELEDAEMLSSEGELSETEIEEAVMAGLKEDEMVGEEDEDEDFDFSDAEDLAAGLSEDGDDDLEDDE